MKQGHYAMAAPCALGVATLVPSSAFIKITCAALVIWSSPWPDLDHSRFSRRVHPGAALVRVYARQMYRLHTAKDEATWRTRRRKIIFSGEKYNPRDVHRGPSHCIESALLGGYLSSLLFGRVPFLYEDRWWLGLAIFVGLTSHIVSDALTPSGVPFSAIYNYIVYKEVWRRHVVGWHIIYSDVWYLRWIRYPVVFSVDEQDDEYRPGIFRTNSGSEKLLFVPVMWMITGACALGMIGLLPITIKIMTGGLL